MMNTFSTIGSGQTPKIVIKLILITIIASLCSALWESFFTVLLNAPRIQPFFSLSWWGISHFFLWQPITYLFIVDSYGGGVTLFYLIALFFRMYIIWMLGSALCQFAGPRQFLQLYLGSGILSAFVALFFLFFTGSSVTFAGPAPALLALFTAWAMLNPEMEILLFFVFPLRIKWLFAAIVGAIFLVNVSQLAFISLFFYGSAVLFGYIYSATVWQLSGPFPFLDPFDQTLARWQKKISSKMPKNQGGSKIVQLFSGKPHLDDDAFVDEMLAKISEKGPDSLSWTEKKRMDSIAKKRQR